MRKRKSSLIVLFAAAALLPMISCADNAYFCPSTVTCDGASCKPVPYGMTQPISLFAGTYLFSFAIDNSKGPFAFGMGCGYTREDQIGHGVWYPQIGTA